MIRGKLQDGFRTMFGFHARRNSTDSPNSLMGSPKMGETPRSGGGSPRIEVGEIDTSAPFQSVKAAVSLFGEAGSPKNANKPLVFKKTKPNDERVLEKETRIHLALKELEDYKERLRSTETTKAQAIRELEKANKTLQELTNKLQIISESKHGAIESTEAANQRAMEIEERKLQGGGNGSAADDWKLDVDSQREQYKASSVELISAKQELTILRQDFDVVLEAKLAAFQQAADAQHITKVNQERASRLSKEIKSLRETLGQVKLATLDAQEEQSQHNGERLARLESHARAKNQVEQKLKDSKEEYDAQPHGTLGEKLEVTTEATKLLQEQLDNVRESDMSSLRSVTAAVDDAKKELLEMVEEENKQRSSMDVLKLEMENVMRELLEWKDKAIKAELTVESLQAELEGCRAQLQAGERDPEHLCDDMNKKLQQLALETESARREAEEIGKNIALLKQETETTCIAAKEAEDMLKSMLDEVEVAKEAERQAGAMIHSSSVDDGVQDSSSSKPNGKIKLSIEDYEALNKKAEDSTAGADLKVATITAQIETIKVSENEALRKLEALLKEREAMEAAIEEAEKQAEMAEAAKQVVEGELLKWRQEQTIDVIEDASFSLG